MAETTRCLLRQVRDLAYRAEDTISLYAAIKDPSRMSSNFFKDGYSVHKIGSEIKKIKSEVESVSKAIESLGIKSFIRGQSSYDSQDVVGREEEVEKLVSLLVGDEEHPVISLWGMGGIGKTTIEIENIKTELEDVIRNMGIDIFIQGPTYSSDSQDFVGREEEVEKLVSLLVGNGSKPVFSLWGMGGIGKTTIARKVYNHPSTRDSFESFAWVCVSQKFDTESVLVDVLKQLSPHENTSNLSLTDLTHKLLQVQEATKCMLVIDDIWSIEHWGELQPAFYEKTKILLATRNHEVAKIGSAIKVGLLSDDESWELLKRKASKRNNFPDFQTEESSLETIVKEMVAKCGNLPLAISLLGDILSEEKSSEGWDLVYRNVMKGHQDLKDGTHRVLRLSYLDLPYYLKPCFLYMSVYKEGELITAIDLCLMWIAQGMVSRVMHSKEVELVDIAQEYLSELVSRSLVEVVHDDRHRGQTTRLCKLHKVVREMCLSMAVEEDFGMQVVDYEGEAFSHFWHDSLSRTKTRHLVVNFKREVQRESKNIIKCYKNNTITVRTLLLINGIPGRPEIEFPKCGLKKFKVLKSLYISGVKFKDGKLPESISKLIVLRSLRLRFCNFDELPSFVSKLLYLHTLDLWNCGNIRIPNNVLSRMPRLRHLFFPTYFPSYFEKENSILILEGLEKLETLVGFNSLVHRLNSPTEMTKLRHFEGIFHDNQSLSEIIHASCTSWKNLKCGGLQIGYGCSFSSEQGHVMLFNKLFNLHNLHMLIAIGNLFKELELENQVRISNLQTLILSESDILEDPMEILGKLPILLDLSMIGGCFQGGEITCSAFAFPSLERLEIRDLPRLGQWNVEKGTMPALYKLVIGNCPCLKMVPDGFKFLEALTELHVCGMTALGERVSKEGEDFHKVRHVPSVVIRD